MKPTHICFSANQAWNIYNFRRGLLERLLRDGIRVSILAPQDACSALLHELGCTVVDIKISAQGVSPVQDLKLLATYIRRLRELRPDLLITYTIKPNIFGVLAARFALIPTLAVTTGLGYTFINENLVARIARVLYCWAFRYPLQVWFLNQDDLDAFIRFRLIDPDRAVVIPGEGIDLEHYRPERSAASQDRFRCLLIARMLWDKGIGEFVDAARTLKLQHPEIELQLLGQIGVGNPSAVTQAEMEAWCQQGAVSYLGTSADVRRWIRDADCVVLPSYREGMPRTLMEAAAMEKPLVATDVPGCRDVVVDGVNGLLCRPRDAADLADKLRQMFVMSNADRAAMGTASRELMKQRFDEQAIIERYLAFLSSHGFFSGFAKVKDQSPTPTT